MEIIGAGFGRTGTLSLQIALNTLGFGPCYHMMELVTKPEHIDRWRRALASDPVDAVGALSGYRSTVDWPGCTYWRQLVEAYPDAKVLLTTRDPHRWYESAHRTIFGPHLTEDKTGLPAQASAFSEFMLSEFQPRIMDVGRDKLLHQMGEDEAVEIFEKHIAEVRATVPADRLLVFEVAEGWEPLCDFLGVPVPDEPFPHVNRSGEEFDVNVRGGANSSGEPVGAEG
jgi:Sulfotransferase domain